mmetsp:Transcript_46640/g.118054  ORF Transcript_46640/g.118054 Transcript_46640/m.118054 type:complete len:284 (-) Transcript_46640:322-1173(-)
MRHRLRHPQRINLTRRQEINRPLTRQDPHRSARLSVRQTCRAAPRSSTPQSGATTMGSPQQRLLPRLPCDRTARVKTARCRPRLQRPKAPTLRFQRLGVKALSGARPRVRAPRMPPPRPVRRLVLGHLGRTALQRGRRATAPRARRSCVVAVARGQTSRWRMCRAAQEVTGTTPCRRWLPTPLLLGIIWRGRGKAMAAAHCRLMEPGWQRVRRWASRPQRRWTAAATQCRHPLLLSRSSWRAGQRQAATRPRPRGLPLSSAWTPPRAGQARRASRTPRRRGRC